MLYHTFIHSLSRATILLQLQRWVVITEIIWPTKLKVFTIWVLTEKVCHPFVKAIYILFIQVNICSLAICLFKFNLFLFSNLTTENYNIWFCLEYHVFQITLLSPSTFKHIYAYRVSLQNLSLFFQVENKLYKLFSQSISHHDHPSRSLNIGSN